ncbi:MAG: FixH family protein [Chloroflexi bacterium]|nr:FixH family protein [Chloroflexota bacterium]MBI4506933.1 FixH family protein [Chloroflexota bacterium]
MSVREATPEAGQPPQDARIAPAVGRRPLRAGAYALLVAGVLVGVAAARAFPGSASEPVVRQAAAQPQIATTGPATAGERMVMAVVETGVVRPFRNGEQVLTSGPFALRMRFDPYPPAGAADLDITVVDDEDDRLIGDAVVTLRGEMPGHGHGVAPVRLPNRGAGHYGMHLNLTMAGDWTFDVDVRRGGQHGTLKVLLSAMSFSAR